MAEPTTYTLTGYTDGAAVLAALNAGAASLPADQGTIQRYVETGATLTVDDDGDGSYSITVPLDGRRYSVTVTQDVDVVFELPADASERGSAIVDFYQDATGNRVITLPATVEYSNRVAETFELYANKRTAATFLQFSATGVDAYLDKRGTPA